MSISFCSRNSKDIEKWTQSYSLKILQKEKFPGPDGVTGEFDQTYKEGIKIKFYIISSVNRKERNTTQQILWGKHYLDTKTRLTSISKENYRPMSLMDTNAKLYFPILLRKHRTLCYFKIHSMLIWYTCILQNNNNNSS